MFIIIFARENTMIQYATNSFCPSFIIRYYYDIKASFTHGLRRHFSSLVLNISLPAHATLPINLLSKLITSAQEFQFHLFFSNKILHNKITDQGRCIYNLKIKEGGIVL